MAVPHTGKLLLMSVLILCLGVGAYEDDRVKKRSSFPGQRPRLTRQSFDALQQSNTDVDFLQRLECNIEVEVIDTVGGRCVKLDDVAVCQSGKYTDEQNNACSTILAAHEMEESGETTQSIDAECHIEIETIEVIGGLCEWLGVYRRMAVCYSGVYLEQRSDTCLTVLTERNSRRRRQIQYISPTNNNRIKRRINQ